MHRLHRLPRRAEARIHGQAGQHAQQARAGAFIAVDQRRLDDHGRQRQAGQKIVGAFFTAVIRRHGALVRAQRRQLYHQPHLALGAGGKQRAWRLRVQRGKGLRTIFGDDADAVDDDIDAVQARQPDVFAGIARKVRPDQAQSGRPGLAGYWGVLFERYVSRILDRRKVAPMLAAAGATAVACFVDYKMTPHRLQPGYEMRLSRPALLLVYGAFGVGLAAGAWWLRRR